MKIQKQFYAVLIMLLIAATGCSVGASPTATPVPATQVPTALPTTPPSSPTPKPDLTILKEDFSGTSGALSTYKDVDGTAIYKNGAFVINITKPSNFVYGATKQSGDYKNVSVEVEAVKASGFINAYPGLMGIACNWADDQNFNALLISSDGQHYSITKSSKDGLFVLLDGQDYAQANAAINATKDKDFQSNKLRAECAGDVMALYVNNKKVAETSMPGSGASGSGIALLGSTNGSTGVGGESFQFKNLVVSKLAATPVAATSNKSGRVILKDDFEGNKRWSEGKIDTGIMSYAKGTYHLSLPKADTFFMTFIGPIKYSDSRIEVDVTIAAGVDKSYGGVMFRSQLNGNDNDYYDFVIGNDGVYSIGKNVKGKFTELVDFTPSDLVKKGNNQIHRLRMDAVGDTLTFYINGQKLKEIKDSDLKLGGIGFEGGAPKSGGGTEMVFDNLVVTYP